MEKDINSFDPNGVGLKNGHFIGLPFTEKEANIVLISVPWDVTVSYNDGTSRGPERILEASPQLDLYDEMAPDAWQAGIYMRPPDRNCLKKNKKLRKKAASYIRLLEEGEDPSGNQKMKQNLARINEECETLMKHVEKESSNLLAQKKIVGIVGGDHSSPLGLMRALAKENECFGILQIDAHMDLRQSYEGFTYSHASIFHNAMQIPQVEKLVQVAVRDFCEEEIHFAEQNNKRIRVFTDRMLKGNKFQNIPWQAQSRKIVEQLPDKVYISFDIDGLNPAYCPNTGTPVPGGLEFEEMTYLLEEIVEQKKTIIGFDLCEVAGKGEQWDANVGARVLYKMCNLTAKSHHII